MNIYQMRREYSPEPLEISQLDKDPFVQFGNWFEEASSSGSTEANAVALATTGKDMMPSLRMVLLKSFSDQGFVFFTNYLSKKGRQLSENNRAAMLFYWPGPVRQARMEGYVSKLSREDSDEYFRSRPALSRASAILSRQSEILEDKQDFDLQAEYLIKTGDIETRPAHWGGYLLKPVLFEFWQGGRNRSHDRFQYTIKNGEWNIVRLYP